MIAQHDGKIVGVENKIIQPMISSGPIIYGRTVTSTKYLTYGASVKNGSTYYDDIPVINSSSAVLKTEGFNPTQALGVSRPVPSTWSGKRMATASAHYQGSGDGFEYYDLFTSSVPASVSYYSYPRTISCLFKYWKYSTVESIVTAAVPEAIGYANIGLPDAPVLTAKMEGTNLILTIKPNYYRNVTPDGAALEVYNGWTKSRARVGTTSNYYYYLTKTIDTTEMTSLPWYRFTAVFESNMSFYVYINDKIAGRFTSTATQGIGYDSFDVGLRDLTYSEDHEKHRLSITELFVAGMDLTSRNRSVLNVGPQPDTDGLLPSSPLIFSAD